MNIREFSERTGLSPHTLRYYEKIDLLTGIHRNLSGHRVFTEKDLDWVRFIVRLKETGMRLKDMLEYAHLRSIGDSTVEKRRKLLALHREKLKSKIAHEIRHLKALEAKIDYYKKHLDLE